MLSSKIYIDFGEHPGMDRLPREAAINGLIVITNKAGAAFYKEDVGIKEKYKVLVFDEDFVHEVFIRCFSDDGGYESCVSEFEGYRGWILGQEKIMEERVSEFVEWVGGEREKEQSQVEKKSKVEGKK